MSSIKQEFQNSGSAAAAKEESGRKIIDKSSSYVKIRVPVPDIGAEKPVPKTILGSSPFIIIQIPARAPIAGGSASPIDSATSVATTSTEEISTLSLMTTEHEAINMAEDFHELLRDDEIPILFAKTLGMSLKVPISTAELWDAFETIRTINNAESVQVVIKTAQLKAMEQEFVRDMAAFSIAAVPHASLTLKASSIEHIIALQAKDRKIESKLDELREKLPKTSEPEPQPEEFFDCVRYTATHHTNSIIKSMVAQGEPVWLVDNVVFRFFVETIMEQVLFRMMGTDLPLVRLYTERKLALVRFSSIFVYSVLFAVFVRDVTGATSILAVAMLYDAVFLVLYILEVLTRRAARHGMALYCGRKTF